MDNQIGYVQADNIEDPNSLESIRLGFMSGSGLLGEVLRVGQKMASIANDFGYDLSEEKGKKWETARIEFYQALKAIEATIAQPSLWQPIETVPKNGISVLLWDGEQVQLAQWRSYQYHYPGCKPEWAWCLPGSDQDEQGGCETVDNPSHWMQLPKPPQK